MISSCGITGNVAQQKITSVVNEPAGRIDAVYFCPRDNCDERLSELILSAKEKVHCAFFDLDLENVKNALECQHEKGIDVKIVIDSDNYEQITNLKIPIKLDNRSAFMHNKFCVVDNKVSTGSFNPTANCAYKNNNNLIVLRSNALAKNYEEEFNELWHGTFGKGSRTKMPIVYLNNTKIENYFCPEDKCSEKIEQALKQAEKSIYFLLFDFTHTGIANEIVMKLHEGVEAKGVFEKIGAGSKYSRYNLLDFQGADVRKDSNSNMMHHKVFIIDDFIVITGSFNPTKNADTSNDENILIIYDKEVAKEYKEEFEYIWTNYSGE